jgi:hypothetical protein
MGKAIERFCQFLFPCFFVMFGRGWDKTYLCRCPLEAMQGHLVFYDLFFVDHLNCGPVVDALLPTLWLLNTGIVWLSMRAAGKGRMFKYRKMP